MVGTAAPPSREARLQRRPVSAAGERCRLSFGQVAIIIIISIIIIIIITTVTYRDPTVTSPLHTAVAYIALPLPHRHVTTGVGRRAGRYVALHPVPQACIYSTTNWNTPHIIELRGTVSLILQSE